MGCIYSAAVIYKSLLTYNSLIRGAEGGNRRRSAPHRRTSYCHILSPSTRGSGIRVLSKILKTVANLVVSPTGYGVPIIGFSATFSRHDGLALDSVVSRIADHLASLGTTEAGWSYKRPDSAFIHTNMVFAASQQIRCANSACTTTRSKSWGTDSRKSPPSPASTFPISGRSRKRFVMRESARDTCTQKLLRPNGSRWLRILG